MGLGAVSQRELAAHLSTSSVSVVKLIDRMERDGWVVRKQSPEDRRVKLLFLTPKAKSVWKDLTVHARAVIEQAHQGISEKEVSKVKKILSRIRKNLAT
jgi:MarR family transcriptional regulator for hemolysin